MVCRPYGWKLRRQRNDFFGKSAKINCILRPISGDDKNIFGTVFLTPPAFQLCNAASLDGQVFQFFMHGIIMLHERKQKDLPS